VGLAGIYAALKCAGVVDVDLIAPAARVAISAGQAAYCTGITLTVEVEGG
jgi:phage-related baseplate assembly protein